MSYHLKAPIKLRTDYDPQSDLEKIILQQIDDMDRQEFQQDLNLPSNSSVLHNNRASESVHLDTLAGHQQAEGSELRMTGATLDNMTHKGGKVKAEFKLFTSKLAKFKNTKLKILCFGPAN